MIRPLFNMCKIEVIDDYAEVIRNTGDEQVQKGVLVDFRMMAEHLTASTGHSIEPSVFDLIVKELEALRDKTVHYAQYADSGQVIEEDGKRFAFVPFYRIIGVEE